MLSLKWVNLYLIGKNSIKRKIRSKNITLNIDGKNFTNGFCVNVGNPHIIFFVKDCFEHDLKI